MNNILFTVSKIYVICISNVTAISEMGETIVGVSMNIKRMSLMLVLVLSLSVIFTGTVSAQELQGAEEAKGLLTDAAKWLLGICVSLATVMIIIGSIMYMTSTGNPGKMATAKATVINTVIALAAAVGSTLIASAVYAMATNRLG